MRRLALVAVVVLALGAVLAGPANQPASQDADVMKIVPDIEARVRQFGRAPLAPDLSPLAAGDRDALTHLVEAARVVHEVFQRQAWRGGPAFRARLAASTAPRADAAREYYRIMAKPWDELREREPFVGGLKRPPGAGFYPEDMTRDEFEKHLQARPRDRAAFMSPTTIVERRDGRLVAVPYSTAFRNEMKSIAKELRAAAKLATSPSLRRFLESRARALLSDDYFESDMAWMELDGPIEIVLGPYETYEDSLFGYKASFESFVCVVQPEESQRLARYKGQIPFLERNLPLADEHKNLTRGAASPISVVDVVFAAGDARSGVQTIAFNLPNDERVREAKGSKKVLLKNMMRAKYDAILRPISQRVLPPGDAAKVDFESYFHFILFHEMSHGLGPGRITLDGRQTEARLELKDLYSAIEEAKADILGVYNLYALADKGVVPGEIVAPLPWTYAAGLFRSARFGVAEAHGLGVVLQTNFLLSKGAVEMTADGRFAPSPERFRPAVADLARLLLEIEAKGDYARARQLIAEMGTPPPAMRSRIDELKDIPVDVDPYYTLFEQR